MTIDELKRVVLSDVVYAPGFSQTLISVKRLIDDGMKVEFTDAGCNVYGPPVMQGVATREVYSLKLPTPVAAVALRRNSIEDWHQRLNHLNYRAITQLANSGAVKGLKIVGRTTPAKPCEICALSKIHRAPAPQVATRSKEAQDEVCHGDLSGPFKRSYNGIRYYLALKWMDHISVYFLKHKSEAAGYFRTYLNVVNRRFDGKKNILIFRSDNGGEFLGSKFKKVCDDEGITMEESEPEVHHQNGVIERTHRTVTESARAAMLQAQLPHYLWEYAVRNVVLTKNRVLSKGDPTKTPFEKFWGRRPDMKNLRAFGQKCVVLIPDEKRSTTYKFRPKGRTGVFIGSDPQRKGYFVYVTGRGHQVVHSRSVVFLEPPSDAHNVVEEDEDPMGADSDSESEDGSDGAADVDTTAAGVRVEGNSVKPTRKRGGLILHPRQPRRSQQDETLPLRRSARIAGRALSAAGATLDEIIQAPLNLREARASPHWPQWERAIWAEIQALRDNDTFELVDPPPGVNVIGTMIAFRVKEDENGSIERLKARICAQGFTQEFLKDYFETYAPVARLNSIRVFVALATQLRLHVRQGDVPTAYVKARLNEVIYVRQPKGFEEGSRTKVWRLKKALYGLKQAGREWNAEINAFLVEYGLVPTREDRCVYTHPDHVLIVLIYVDDILIGYRDEVVMQDLMNAMDTKYGVKDLGEAKWFLGISLHFDHTRGVTTLNQTKFASEVTKRFGMNDCRPRKTPMDSGTILYRRGDDEEAAGDVPYRQAVGALLYLARVTRPDIMYAVNQVAAHVADPSKAHWTVKNILRYVDATKTMGLTYQRSLAQPPVRVYTDADWANNEEDRRSISGAVVQVYGCAVAWQTRRQRVVSKSSTIAEYIAADDGVEEARWTMFLVNRLMKCDVAMRIPAMLDNKSTIKRLTNGKSSDAQKTVDCKFFAIREAVDNGELELTYCPKNVMLADTLTKALPRTRFQELREALGVRAFSAGGEVLGHPA